MFLLLFACAHQTTELAAPAAESMSESSPVPVATHLVAERETAAEAPCYDGDCPGDEAPAMEAPCGDSGCPEDEAPCGDSVCPESQQKD